MCGGCIYVIKKNKKKATSREYRVGGVEGYRRIGREVDEEKRSRREEEEEEDEEEEEVERVAIKRTPCRAWPAATLHKKL